MGIYVSNKKEVPATEVEVRVDSLVLWRAANKWAVAPGLQYLTSLSADQAADLIAQLQVGLAALHKQQRRAAERVTE